MPQAGPGDVRRTGTGTGGGQIVTHTEQLENKLESVESDEKRLALLASLVTACSSHTARPAQASAKGLEYGEQAVDLAMRMSGEPHARSCLRDALIGMSRIRRRDGARESAIALAERALGLAEEDRDARDTGRAATLLGRLWLEAGERERARSLHRRAFDTAVEAQDRALTAEALIGLGVVHTLDRRYDEALEALLDALAMAEEGALKEISARALHRVGDVHFLLGNPETALEQYRKSQALWEEMDAKPPLAGVLIGIGLAHQRQGDGDTALRFLERALRLAEDAGDRARTAKALNRLAGLYLERSEHRTALAYGERSLDIRRKIGDKRGTAHTLLEIGRLRIELEEYSAAKKAFDQALELAHELEDERLELAVHNSLSALWKQRGDYQQAYTALRRYVDGKLGYFREETRRALAEAQARYELEEREREAEIYRLKSVELADANRRLKQALEEVKMLNGLLPICGSCKRIRDEQGAWTRMEAYIQARSSARFSHGICPDCAKDFR